jgi:hypothetical protein
MPFSLFAAYVTCELSQFAIDDAERRQTARTRVRR